MFLFEHDVEIADAHITAKGFKYHKAQKGENGHCDIMIWLYGRNINNNNAASFVTKTCYVSGHDFIRYQMSYKSILMR